MKMENIILMKYGYHANEEVDAIIKRKEKEIKDVGYCFWGYGGTLLHPLTQTQPFCKNKKVYLLLTSTPSKFENSAKRANYFSIDKIHYEKIPKGINVLGSKHALVFKDLQKVDMEINLCDYEIGIGVSLGKNLGDYFHGRVDKAIAIYKGKSQKEKKIHIDYIAELISPYAVFIKEEL